MKIKVRKNLNNQINENSNIPNIFITVVFDLKFLNILKIGELFKFENLQLTQFNI